MDRKIPTMLADHVEKNGLQGQLKYHLFVGASSGAETENRWAKLNMIERRAPHQVGKEIAKGINNGNIKFFDKHLSMFPVDLMYGFYTKDKENNRLDVAIVEVCNIRFGKRVGTLTGDKRLLLSQRTAVLFQAPVLVQVRKSSRWQTRSLSRSTLLLPTSRDSTILP